MNWTPTSWAAEGVSIQDKTLELTVSQSERLQGELFAATSPMNACNLKKPLTSIISF